VKVPDPGVIYDIAVIGGGVNGCGIARDAAGRGASVVLFEQGDLASGTSSASTKLIHGGLRYLENFEFRLVREALAEREVLWQQAPHIVWPLRFVLPHHRGLRPRFALRFGLFLYDHLGGRKLLPTTRSLDLSRDAVGAPLKSLFTHGFEYSDCCVDDSRLVVLVARDAAERGAAIHPHTRVVAATRTKQYWQISAEMRGVGGRQLINARVLINAAGPWVSQVLTDVVRTNAPAVVRLVKGSHIVVPRLFDHDRAYIFQNEDGRVIFAIPYEGEFTLIGTTECDYEGDPAEAGASDEEILYLCKSVSEYFRDPVRVESVVWSYAGVRPLNDNGAANAQEASRDYELDFDVDGGRAPLLSVFGGKITTYRRLAEAVLDRLRGHLPSAGRPAWTAGAPLPGGDFPHDRFDEVVSNLLALHPYLHRNHAVRLVRSYGTRSARVLDGARKSADLGPVFGADLTEREVSYLTREEWAASAEDILWRRSKLGLRFSAAQKAALAGFMRQESVSTSSAA
jgi:glycerol-3-phosphate dehydrogenase